MPDRETVIIGLTEAAEYLRAKADIAGIGKGKEIFDSWYRAVMDAAMLLGEAQRAAKDINVPGNDWISVKERLPDKDGEYLVCIHNVYADEIKIAGFSTDKTKEHSYLEAGYGWSDYDPDYGYYDCGNVTHWMPLPEFPEEDDLK